MNWLGFGTKQRNLNSPFFQFTRLISHGFVSINLNRNPETEGCKFINKTNLSDDQIVVTPRVVANWVSVC